VVLLGIEIWPSRSSISAMMGMVVGENWSMKTIPVREKVAVRMKKIESSLDLVG